MRCVARNLKRFLWIIFLFLVGVVTCFPAFAANHINATPQGIAITGYDAVAYFTQSKPVKGEAQYHTEWMGVKWYFASAADAELFRSNPEKYAPQYGGNCAWAAAQGLLAHGNPLVWKIVDGKLYFNFNKPTQANWEKDAANFIKKADSHWPGLNK